MIIIKIRKNTILKVLTMASLVIDIMMAANIVWGWVEFKNWYYIFWAMAQLWLLLYSVANFPRAPKRKKRKNVKTK